MKSKNTTTVELAQQGDVILRRLSSVPTGNLKILAAKHCTLAHGESGHSHVVEDDEAELIQIGERILLKLAKATMIKHEEHKPILLEPGIWEVGRVREYDYFAKMARPVQD